MGTKPSIQLQLATPTHLWAVLFVRDAWQVDIGDHVPTCEPRPRFAELARVATPSDRSMLLSAWEGWLGRELTAPDENQAWGVFESVREAGQVDVWREWSASLKTRIAGWSRLGHESPLHFLRDELAVARPDLTTVAVLPAAGGYAQIAGNTLYVSLRTCEDVSAFRSAVTHR